MKYSDPRINKAALQSALLFIISDEYIAVQNAAKRRRSMICDKLR